jgi:hypothetical protein
MGQLQASTEVSSVLLARLGSVVISRVGLFLPIRKGVPRSQPLGVPWAITFLGAVCVHAAMPHASPWAGGRRVPWQVTTQQGYLGGWRKNA